MCTSRFSICWAYSPVAKTSAAIAVINLMTPPLIGIPKILLNSAPVEQRLREGAGIDVFQLAAKRHAARDARCLHVTRAQHLRDVMRGRLALVGEVGRQDHFLDLAVRGADEQ